jgi:hypothetical protein
VKRAISFVALGAFKATRYAATRQPRAPADTFTHASKLCALADGFSRTIGFVLRPSDLSGIVKVAER